MLDLLLGNPLVNLIWFVFLVISISVHEASHALVATLLGDDTPRLQGRLTLNPKAHLDPLGTVLIVLIGIGWGRPVIFNPYNLKKPRRDTMLISLAGPSSNLLLAVVVAVFTRYFIHTLGAGQGIFAGLAASFVMLNVMLAIFNLIPIDPLDGFKVISGILPRGLVMDWEATRKYGIFLLIFLLLTNWFEKMFYPVATQVSRFIGVTGLF